MLYASQIYLSSGLGKGREQVWQTLHYMKSLFLVNWSAFYALHFFQSTSSYGHTHFTHVTEIHLKISAINIHYRKNILLYTLKISMLSVNCTTYPIAQNTKPPSTVPPYMTHYLFLKSMCRNLECDSCTVSDTNFPSLSLSHRHSFRRGIIGDSYSLGTIPSTDDSKKLKSGNHIRVLFESLCIRAWLLASVW
jgi:hypothetical protein